MEDSSLNDLNVATAFSFLSIVFLVSFYFKLRLESSILISAVRCYIQLSLLGYVLKPVLQSDSILWVIVMAVSLTGLGSLDIFWSKLRWHHSGVLVTVFTSLFMSCIWTSVLGAIFCLKTDPFYLPRQFIPITGLLIGNAMGAVAVALNQFLEQVHKSKEEIEFYLASGATRWEATRTLVYEATKNGLLPTLNSMSVTGLISIPGMLAGQLLSGAPTGDAIRYQQITMYLIAASSALATMSTVLVATTVIVDHHHCLRLDRLNTPRSFQKCLKEVAVDVFYRYISRSKSQHKEDRRPISMV